MDTETINSIGDWMLMGPIYAVTAVFAVLAVGYLIYLLVQIWKEEKAALIIVSTVIAWFVVAVLLRMYQ
jgi:hypothetical protein